MAAEPSITEGVDTNSNTDTWVCLVRMEGKIDRVVDGFERQTEDIKDVRVRLNGHSERIRSLETYENKRQGALILARMLWVMVGASVMGLFALLFKANVG